MNETPTSAVNSPLLLSARDAARLCAVSERTWRSWDAAGHIPRAIAVGRSRFWRRLELEAWIQRGCPDRQSWQTCGQDPTATGERSALCQACQSKSKGQ